MILIPGFRQECERLLRVGATVMRRTAERWLHRRTLSKSICVGVGGVVGKLAGDL